MNVLVTGGAGFIGSHVVDCLVRRADTVVVLDDLSGGMVENVCDEAVFVEGSILDNDLVAKLFKTYQFDYVYHLAAYAAEGLSHFIRRFNYLNNLIGSVNIINAAINGGTKALIFTSSIAVYGSNQVPMHEDMVPRPEDPYGVAKAAVENDLRVASDMFGMDYVVFRPHNVYGERQNIGDRYRNVIGIFMNQIMKGEPLTIFGDGEQTRAFSYIGDVAPVIAEAAFVHEARNGVFNIGADRPYSVNALAAATARSMGTECRVVHMPARKEVMHAYANHENVERVFGYRAAVDLDVGLARMAQWAREVGPRSSKRFGQVEVGRNLPASWVDSVSPMEVGGGIRE